MFIKTFGRQSLKKCYQLFQNQQIQLINTVCRLCYTWKKDCWPFGKGKKWTICEDNILLLQSRSRKKQMHRYGKRKSSQSGPDGDGMQVPCHLKLEGDTDFVTLLKKQLLE